MELQDINKCNVCGWGVHPGAVLVQARYKNGFYYCPDCNAILNPETNTVPQGNKFDQEKRRMDLIPIGPLYD